MVSHQVVQFAEKNWSASGIASISGDKLIVRSIFSTLQGEGPYCGYPAVFVRLGGCNRGAKKECPFCDASFEVDKSKLMSVQEVVKAIEKYRHPSSLDKPIVVITGGEPLLHANVEKLNTILYNNGYTVQVETNGDLLRNSSMHRAVMVVSPKASPSTKRYTKPPKEMLERADYLKILVSADPNSPYHKLPDYLFDYADKKGSYHIFISPVNEQSRELREDEVASMWSDLYDKEKAAASHAYAAQLCQKYAYRLSIQMHVYTSIP